MKLILKLLLSALFLSVLPGAYANGVNQDPLWDDHLRQAYFGDRPIDETTPVIELDLPERAEDPATVPVAVTAKFPQTETRYIKQITLLIDKNPAPLAGRFTFSPHSGRADLSLRIRVNEFSPVRAVAELNDGSLHMAKGFVKASGGCSAPLATDLDRALSRLGKMRLKVGGMAPAAHPLPTQLRVSHPNITGLQVTQPDQPYFPPHYVKSVSVSFDGETVFSAETDISISADPSFGFYFMPSEAGELVAQVTDNTGETFTKTFSVSAR